MQKCTSYLDRAEESKRDIELSEYGMSSFVQYALSHSVSTKPNRQLGASYQVAMVLGCGFFFILLLLHQPLLR